MAEATAASAPGAAAPVVKNGAATKGVASVTTPADAVVKPKPVGAKPVVETKPTPEERKLKISIEGQDEWLTEAQAITRLQKQKWSEKQTQEAAKARKEAEALARRFQEDPEAALIALGKDPAAFFEAHLAKKAKLELMSPEQQETYKIQQERDQLKAEKEQTLKERQDQEELDAFKVTRDKTMKTLMALADKHGLDETPETLDDMLKIGMEAIELGYPLTYDQLAVELKLQREEAAKSLTKVLTTITEGPKLLEYLGPDVVKRVLKATIEARDVKSTTPKAKRNDSTTALPTPSNGKTYRPAEWAKLMKAGKI